MGARFFFGVTLSGCEIKHSPSSRAEVQNETDYISSLPVWFHGVVRENVAFTFMFLYISSPRRFNKGLNWLSLNYFRCNKTGTVHIT